MLKEFRQERIDFAKFHKTATKEVRPMFRNALIKSYQPVIDAVESGMDMQSIPVDAIIKKDVWRNLYVNAYEKIGMRMAKREFYRQRNIEGLSQKATAIDFLVDIWSGTLKEYALKYTYSIERLLNEKTVEIITRALGEAYELGLDKYGRTRLFLKAMKDNVNIRSLTISRTETTTMANIGKAVGAQSWIDKQGGGGYKVWLGRVIDERPTHIETNDTIIPIDDLYLVGGEPCERPGDVSLSAKERINCRCTQSFMSQNIYNQYVKRGRIVNGKLVGAS